jgi:NADP-dependent 3-hydroxy acid dehydrogenase YdfG
MTGQVTLITGGSSGIGAATASRLLAAGHRVAVTGRDPDRLHRFATQVGSSNLLTVVGDATEPAAVSDAVKCTVDRFGRLDFVVANAGIATFDNVVDGNPDGWREMVLTNVLGPALLIRASVQALRETGGRIVLVGSVAGFVHTRGNLYGATKWAITGLAENTRMIVAEHGVSVTLIAPGRVDTPFWDPAGGTPPGGLSPENIADTIAWAISQPPGVDVSTVVIRPGWQSPR